MAAPVATLTGYGLIASDNTPERTGVGYTVSTALCPRGDTSSFRRVEKRFGWIKRNGCYYVNGQNAGLELAF